MSTLTLEQLTAWAERKARDLRRFDHKPALEEILGDLINTLQGCFDGAHDPDGRPWPPLELAFRLPLRGKRGSMIQRVVQAHRRGKIEPNRLTVEVDSEVAALHNFGRQKRPLREFLGFSEQDLQQAEGKIADRVSAGILADL